MPAVPAEIAESPSSHTKVPADTQAASRVSWLPWSGKQNPSSRNREKSIISAPRWSLGILNDPETDEVPGSVLLLSKVSQYNEPLGLENNLSHARSPSVRRSHSAPRSTSRRRQTTAPDVKRTSDGKIILDPQPDDSLNDPLNWSVWRRDASLFSLGFYCMLGGGMTTVLAAGFHDVAAAYNTTVPRVALTTGLYMMGLGLGSVVLSPTAILYGKRPVYLIAAICFILSAVWCALSADFPSLIVARVFMGFAVSSVECLPSASIAEIYFLHEKAYRLGIYTFLLLGGKNLIPLVSAAIIESLGWRWVFWIVAIIVGFATCLLFLFVPESFWDRSPTPHKQNRKRSFSAWRKSLTQLASPTLERGRCISKQDDISASQGVAAPSGIPVTRHAHFAKDASDEDERYYTSPSSSLKMASENEPDVTPEIPVNANGMFLSPPARPPAISDSKTGHHNADSPADYFSLATSPANIEAQISHILSGHDPTTPPPTNAYTAHYQSQPQKNFIQQLRPWSGRLSQDKWLRVAARPFILYTYPSILWSAMVYALSVGWLIVLSESVSDIYENRAGYNFTALQTGLVYISPFVGGVLGTVVAGKVSDLIVRFMARRNGGVYEPEFRLVMGIPIALCTVTGLMGYGWSAAERDAWIVPTIFFGIISFGCTLGSTTAITFAVDSYRQYAGEALVTLNFSKNILHGLVFSLFFNSWLQDDGAKLIFVVIGCIQLAFLLTTIPMYIFGKRARLWTVRRDLIGRI